MDGRELQQRVETIRSRVAKPGRNPGAAALFSAAADELKRTQKHLHGAGEAWGEVCPAGLKEKSMVEGVARGTVTIRAADASTRFELDRALREGLERELVKRCRFGVRKVKVVVGEV